jgi:hypothetical protein
MRSLLYRLFGPLLRWLFGEPRAGDDGSPQ